MTLDRDRLPRSDMSPLAPSAPRFAKRVGYPQGQFARAFATPQTRAADRDSLRPSL